MQFLDSLDSLTNDYDAFLLDLWGVIHDGEALYPGVGERLAQLRAAGKNIIFLSNAPRRASAAVAVFEKLGIEEALYDHLLTSGEQAWMVLQTAEAQAIWGEKLFFIGLEKDEHVMEGLPYQRVDSPKDADFILNAGYDYFFQDPEELKERLEISLLKNLPMLCINPDIEVVRQTGEEILCAGHLAREYEKIGGNVTYIGKPYPIVYDTCFDWLSTIAKERILMVGDNLFTDIKGANGQGIDSLYITGGILTLTAGGVPSEVQVRDACSDAAATPTFVAPRFGV